MHVARKLFYKHVLKVQMGERTVFHWRTVFFGPEGVSVGDRTIIGNDRFLDGRMASS